MSNTLLTILIVISISFLNFNYCKESLRFAFALTRNGVRSPLILDENKKDIFGEEWLGRGELTKIGKRQQLLLGYHFYLRYVENLSLLSKVYDPREVYFSSTETNYTLQSSYAQVHGLYLQGVPLVNDAQKNNAIPPTIRKTNIGIYFLLFNFLILIKESISIIITAIIAIKYVKLTAIPLVYITPSL